MVPDTGQITLHATTVAIAGKALIIQGTSGAGKSGLALELMARGAILVADDQTVLTGDGTALWASAPEPLRGLIEARGIGLLKAEYLNRAQVVAVLDMDHTERDRYPHERQTTVGGYTFPLLHNFASPSFAAGLVQYLKLGRKGEP